MSTSKASRLFAALHHAETESRLALRNLMTDETEADTRVRRAFVILRDASHAAIAKEPKRSSMRSRPPRPFFRYKRNGGIRFFGIGPLSFSFSIATR